MIRLRKSLSKISVTELCAGCRVNRKTFYYHFDDINDLVLWIFQEELKEATHLKFTFPDKMAESLYYLIDYIDENRCMCKAVFDSCYRTHLRESWLSEIKELRRTIPITPARVDSLFFTKILTEKGSYCIGPCQLRVQ